MNDRDALRKRLLATFQVEAREHTAELSRTLLALETAPREAGTPLIEVAFRSAHSLKGAARAVNLSTVESLCQVMESVLYGLKRGSLPASPEVVDVLLHAVRILDRLLTASERGLSASSVPTAPAVAALRAVLEGRKPKLPSDPELPLSPPQVSAEGAAAVGVETSQRDAPPPDSEAQEGAAVTSASRASSPAVAELTQAPGKLPSDARLALPAVPVLAEARPADTVRGGSGSERRQRRTPVAPRIHETIRVETGKLERVRRQAEELLGDKLTATEHANQLKQLERDGARFFERWLQRVAAFRPEAHVAAHDRARWNEFLDWTRAGMEELSAELTTAANVAFQNQKDLAARVNALLDGSTRLLMLPCSSVLDGMGHVVRDLARDLGKDVAFEVSGESIEIERRILDDLKDPLVHALRNAVDHGIELPAERLQRNKPARATIRIGVTQTQGNRIEIRVDDDGRGIDASKVKDSALRLGVLSADQASQLDEAAARALVFESEVTTSEFVTDLSGRGLGLAIVREKVERLGGSVRVDSRPGQGTCLCLTLPMSLSTFRGVVVRVGERYFVLPTVHVERALRIPANEVRTIENRATVRFEGRPIAFVSLTRALGMPAGAPPAASEPVTALVVFSGATQVAFGIDEIWQEQDVLLKSLGPLLRALPGTLGATVLGTGKIAPILHAPELLRLAIQAGAGGAPEVGRVKPEAEALPPHILVAEDSITSRTLLKSVLESSGYRVETAVDGMDAFAKLREGAFDLVISDVDMPRLNGLALTARIRADAKLAGVPVILVTSLETREDRERGLDVGANAYLVKRSFEQSNLLGVIRRLL